MTKNIPEYERASFAAFTEINNNLLDLKNNRTKYISSKQVHAIYDHFLKEVYELNVVRKDEELKGMSLNLPTATDLLVDDIWQLLSLLFVTCGLIKFAPATYLSLSTVSKILTHLKECQVFSIDDLKPIELRLAEIRGIIDRSEEELEDEENDNDGGATNHKREELLLLRNKWLKCQQLLVKLQDTFLQIPSDLESVYSSLILIRKSLLNYMTQDSNLLTKDQLSRRVEDLRHKLKKIGDQRDENGKFVLKTGTPEQIDSTQMVLNGVYDDCHNLIHDLSMQRDAQGLSLAFDNLTLEGGEKTTDADDPVISEWLGVYDELAQLKQTLEKLLVTRRWTMRETDLYTYQKQLKRIDETRLLLAATYALQSHTLGETKRYKRAQLLVLYLLRRCYSLVYKLLESSEPVSELLQPIHNQLLTVRRCLLEIKRVNGLNTLRELFPFQFKLALLDNLRHDGKFIVNNQVPEGQGTLNALLAECFDMIHELKIELEEKEDVEENSGDITDEEDKGLSDEVELKRERYAGLTEADYDMASESDELLSLLGLEYAGNDYY